MRVRLLEEEGRVRGGRDCKVRTRLEGRERSKRLFTNS